MGKFATKPEKKKAADKLLSYQMFWQTMRPISEAKFRDL